MILVRFWIWSSCSSLPLDRRNFKATTPASAQWLSRFFPNYLQLPSQPHRPRALSPRRRPPFLWHRNTKIARCVRKGNWLPSPKIIAVIANFLRSCGGLAGLLFFCRVPELKSTSSEFRSRLRRQQVRGIRPPNRGVSQAHPRTAQRGARGELAGA
jgi:hypothetical protein